MLGFRALNTSSNLSVPSDSEQVTYTNAHDQAEKESVRLEGAGSTLITGGAGTRESEEVRVLADYQRALAMCAGDQEKEAMDLLEGILDSSLLEGKSVPVHLISIKFASCKTLAGVYLGLSRHQDALNMLVKALDIESGDISLWYRLAQTAQKVEDYELALSALVRALQINRGHWPSLDDAVLISYILVRWEGCLDFCIRALKKDPLYDTGLYCLQKILQYQPSLRTYFEDELGENPQWLETAVDEVEKEKLEKMIADIKTKIHDQTKPPEEPTTVTFDTPLEVISWTCLASRLLETYVDLYYSGKISRLIDLSGLIPKIVTDIPPDNVDVPIEQEIEEKTEMEGITDGVLPTPDTADEPAQPSLLTALTRSMSIDSSLIEKRRSSRMRGTESIQKDITANLLEGNSGESDASVVLNSLIPERIRCLADKEADRVTAEIEAREKQDETEANSHREITEHYKELLNEDNAAIEAFLTQPGIQRCTMLEIVLKFLRCLSLRYQEKWPADLVSSWVSLYARVRPCLPSSYFEPGAGELLATMHMFLLNTELALDQKQTDLREGRLEASQFTGLNDLVHSCDVFTLMEWMGELEREGPDLKRLWARVLWLRYIFSCMKENHQALIEMKDYLLAHKLTIHRPNCLHGPTISVGHIDCLLSSLEDLCTVEVLEHLFTESSYGEVVEKVRASLRAKQVTAGSLETSDRDSGRQRVLALLLSSWAKMAPPGSAHDRYRDSLMCLEEAWSHVEILTSDTEKERRSAWIQCASDALVAVKEPLSVIRSEPESECKVSNDELCLWVSLASSYLMERSSSSPADVPTMSWILLAQHVDLLEERLPKVDSQSASSSQSDIEDIPAALALLHKGHIVASRGERCSADEGVLLKALLSRASIALDSAHYEKDEVEFVLEQAVYCLCGLTRKGKGRRSLEEHATQKVGLDWETAVLLLKHLKPEVVPEFDSVKTLSIQSDMANVLADAVKIAPESQWENAFPKTAVLACIQGEKEIPQGPLISYPLSEMLYLVADYHMKNNEFEEAIEYYMEDLRFCPVRFDSWAALALIYSNQIEQILNLTDTKTEDLNGLLVSQCFRCYEMAFTLDVDNITLRIEQGSLAYEIHSYAAGIVARSNNRQLSSKLVGQCEKWKEEMLPLARSCYELAFTNDADSEEVWLLHYMLAKCAEKERAPLMQVLRRYKQCANALNAAGAKFPKRITFYNKIPYRAVEAIEVFYKSHALVLKHLLKMAVVDWQSHSILYEIEDFLIDRSHSEFVQCAGKARVKSRKRPGKQTEITSTNKRARTLTGFAGVSSQAETSEREDSDAGSECMGDTQGGSGERLEEVDEEVVGCVRDLVDSVVLDRPHPDPQELWEHSWRRCINKCMEAFETVAHRLPLHYKAIYHLANLYYSVPHVKDIKKSLEILLGPVDGSKSNVCSLFKDRRQNNFFHGVWRIPVNDIDRSGNFAGHMFRSVLLLLTVLRKSEDWRRLAQLHSQLRKHPPEDKKGFISDSDRIFLARRAFGHAQFSLRDWLNKTQGVITVDTLLRVAKMHIQAVRLGQGVSNMHQVLTIAFNRCPDARGNPDKQWTLDEMVQQCANLRAGNKASE